MPKPSAPAVKLSGAEPGKIEIKTSPGQLSYLFVGSYGLERHACAGGTIGTTTLQKNLLVLSKGIRQVPDFPFVLNIWVDNARLQTDSILNWSPFLCRKLCSSALLYYQMGFRTFVHLDISPPRPGLFWLGFMRFMFALPVKKANTKL